MAHIYNVDGSSNIVNFKDCKLIAGVMSEKEFDDIYKRLKDPELYPTSLSGKELEKYEAFIKKQNASDAYK